MAKRTTKELLSKMADTLGAMVGTPVEKSVEMNPEQFIKYATEQVQKASTETVEKSTLRLKALRKAAEYAATNFTDDESTSIKVPVYVDPGQADTTSTETAVTGASGGGTSTFAKRLEDMTTALASLTKKDGAVADPATAGAAAGGAGEEEWPEDLNTTDEQAKVQKASKSEWGSDPKKK